MVSRISTTALEGDPVIMSSVLTGGVDGRQSTIFPHAIRSDIVGFVNVLCSHCYVSIEMNCHNTKTELELWLGVKMRWQHAV